VLRNWERIKRSENTEKDADWRKSILDGIPKGLPALMQAPIYLIAGIVWILPLKPLLRWMELGRWRT